ISAVSNSVMPRSIALWITLREASRSVRWPKLLQPRPTAETRRPEPPRLRICMDRSCGEGAGRGHIVARAPKARKMRSYREPCRGRLVRNVGTGEVLGTKRCGPGQTRRLTGAAWARDLRR